MADDQSKREFSDTTRAHLLSLEAMDKSLLDVTFRMLQADSGRMFPVDLIAAAAANRSLNLLSGFVAMVRARNLVCAIAILRLQLDTALRLGALSLVDDPHALAQQVVKGEQLRRLRDRKGIAMTDAHLVDVFSTEAPWIREVYDLGCNYVHLSEAHVRHVFGPGRRPGMASVQVGASDPADFHESNYTEAISGFHGSIGFLCHVIESWVSAKNGTQAPSDPKVP